MNNSTLKLILSGMHCVNCAVNIDITLEETPGIISSNTSHTKNQSLVIFDPKKIKPNQITSLIKELGYQSTILE